MHDWFKSYLSQIEQFVNVDEYYSLSLPATCGVPQWSFLGHHLFLLYVNDLPSTSSLLTFHLFADDTNMYFSSKNLSHLEATLNRELNSVAEWMKRNRLALSISQNNLILFHSRKLKPNQSLRIKTVNFPRLWFPCLGFNLFLICNTIIYHPEKSNQNNIFFLNQNLTLSLCSNLSTYLSSMMSLNHIYSLLFISGHVDCYPLVSVNISYLLLLFIHIQRGNHLIEIFM